MEIEQAAAVLRPRRSWEGLDLGFSLARSWLGMLWPLWWAGPIPVALLGSVLAGGRLWLLSLLLWWLKPLYEAPILYWSSRALFGECLSLRRPWPILRGAWTRQLLPFLLWRRFSPGRSFAMSIALLEGLGGAAARQRRRVLGDSGGTAGWLTVACYHFEAILWLGLLVTLYVMVPEGLPRLDLGAALTDSESWPYWVSSALYVVAMSLVAPFYVCGGFAHYLSRRTDLEAWDLDLAFRQASAARGAARLGTAVSRARGRVRGARARAFAGPVAVGVALLAALGSFGSGPQAADLPAPDEARALIGEVLANEDFGRTRTVETWVPIVDPQRPTSGAKPPWAERVGWLLLAVGRVLKWLLLALAVTAVVLIARRALQTWQPSLGRPRASRTLPAAIGSIAPDPAMGLDPETLAEGVRSSLAAGNPRAALALLYRAGLAQLTRRGAEVASGATEGECLRLAERHLSPVELGPFRRIASDWQGLAYAQRLPSPESVSERLEEWIGALAAPGLADVPAPLRSTGIGHAP